MANLSFPFWIVTDAKGIKSPPDETPCDSPQATQAFTTPAALTAYLAKRSSGTFTVNLVSDFMKFLAVAYVVDGPPIRELCVNPSPGGSGGELIPLEKAYHQCTGEHLPKIS